MGTVLNKEYPWQPPRGKVDFGQGRAEAYEAANFPELSSVEDQLHLMRLKNLAKRYKQHLETSDLIFKPGKPL